MIEEIYNAFLSCNQNIATDTRKICKNDLFFALKGPNFNGNEYVEKAISLGAKYAVIDQEKYFVNGKTFLVKNVLELLQKLALHHRKIIKNIPIIGITGTNGKTTTKELMGSVLSQKFKILITEGNLNNHIGVPLTILKISKKHEIAVVEMGASKKGDIKELVEIALPNYGIITNIGKAHLEGFGNINTVKETKFELYDFIIKTKGEIIVNKDDKVLINYIPENIKKHTYGLKNANITGEVVNQSPTVEIKLNNFNETQEIIKTNLLGSYNKSNLLAAVTVGKIFGVNDKLIINSITNYSPTNNRSQLIETKKNTVIADCYNANPTSTLESIMSFKSIAHKSKLIILGDMLELGESSEIEHQQITDYLMATSINVILVGKCYQKTSNHFEKFQNTNLLINFLKKKNVNDSLILLKGSRGIKLEQILKENIL